jgi:hypothetical protein
MMGCHQNMDVLLDDQRTNVFPYLMIKVIFNAVDILVTGGALFHNKSA